MDALPSHTGMAFVFVSHLLPTANSQLAQILSRHTNMPVLVASTAMPIRANHVYMSPPDADLLMWEPYLQSRLPTHSEARADNCLFLSLAEAMGARAIGIILAGYGGDGIEGCKHVRAKGGTTIAQNMSADINGMPLSAQASACVDFVLPPQGITLELSRISRRFRPLSVSKKAGTEPKSILPFDPHIFLAKIGAGHTIDNYRKNQQVFSQGDPADGICYPARHDQAHDRVLKGQRSGRWHARGRRLLWRELPRESADAHGYGHGPDELQDRATGESAGGSGAPRRTGFFRTVPLPSADPQHPAAGGFAGSALPLQRDAAGAGPAPAGPLWYGRQTGAGDCEDQPGNASGNYRHDALSRELFHEQVP